MRSSIEQIVNEHSGNIDSVVTCALHTTYLASLSAFSLRNEKLAEDIHQLQPKMIEAYVPDYKLGVASFIDLILHNHLVNTTAPTVPIKALLGSLIVNLEYALASSKRINPESDIPKALDVFLKVIRDVIPSDLLEAVETEISKLLNECIEKHLAENGGR